MIQQQGLPQCGGERPSTFERNAIFARPAPAQLALFRAITDPLPRPIPAPALLKNSMSAPVQRDSSKNAQACGVHTLLESLHGSAEHAISWMVEENSTFQVLEHVAPQWVDVKPKRGFGGVAFAKPNATDAGSPVTASGFGPPQPSLGDIVTDSPFQPPPTTVTWELPPVLHEPDATVCATVPTLPAVLAVPWAVETKNTFLNVQVPQELNLQRARTDPMHALLEGPTEESQSPLLPVLSQELPVLSLEHIVTDDTSQPTLEVPKCGLRTFSYMDSNLPAKPESLHATALSLKCSNSVSEAVAVNKVEQVVEGFLAKIDPTPALTEKRRQDPLQMHMSLVVASPESKSDGAFEQASASASQPIFVSLPVVPMSAMWLPLPPIAPAPAMEPMPPTRPPAMPAPIMDMPGVPRAPLVPPSHTPGASVVALLKTDLCTPGLIVRAGSGCTHVHWAVDARKLERQDKQAVSPVFMVMLPGYGLAPFKIMLDAKVVGSHGKKAAGFLKVKGCGRVLLKCESQLPESCADIAFRIGVGRDDLLQPFRGTVVHNFFEHSYHGLSIADEEWDFTASIDNHKTFLVTIEVAPKSAFLADPNIWWCPVETEHSAR